MTIASHKKKYSEDGVDIEEEAVFSRFAASVCKASYKNSPFVEVHDFSRGNFRGPRPFTLKNLPNDYFIEASTDGIGTKGVLHDAANTHHLAAYDLIAMTGSDIVRYGGVPLVLLNAFDIVAVGERKSKENKIYRSAIAGLGKAAQEGQIVLLKGETAQMGECIGSAIRDSKTKINWSGTMIGAYAKNKMITGDTLLPGQTIIALKENGFRSNGISAVRVAFQKKFGEEWWKNPMAKKDVHSAAEPSVLYDTFIAALHGWYTKDFKAEIMLHAVVHLSGGGIKEKFAKDILFPRGLGACLDNLWDPPEIMRKCAEWRGIGSHEFYEVWNGGQGALLVVDERDAAYCIKRARTFGISAKMAGKITKGKTPNVLITSRLSKGEKVLYSL